MMGPGPKMETEAHGWLFDTAAAAQDEQASCHALQWPIAEDVGGIL